MKCLYVLYYYIFLFFDFIKSYNYTKIISFQDEKSLRNKRNTCEDELNYNEKRKLNEDLIKCSKIDEISSKNNLCMECNGEQGYFPIINNYNPNKKYIDCHLYEPDKGENNLLGYFFDTKEKAFKKCHENCLSCKEEGNNLINNCITCKYGYIKQPEINSTTNCVKTYDYYYYHTLTGDYSCTEELYCPNEASNLIKTEKKCINNCNENNIYKKQYDGECYEYCPENTEFNESLNKCVDNDLNKCTISIKEMKVNIIHLNFNIINIIVKNYANEFCYTQNHISFFYSNDNYSMVIYKNKSCLRDLNIISSKIFYENCLEKIYGVYNIINPIVVVIDRIGKYANPSIYFAFYNPDTGDILSTSFCDNTSYIIKKNISNIYQKEKYDWLVNQDVDIYDINSSYYHSGCFEFKETPKKDLLLMDRLLNYYPNISLCGINCEYKGTNYITLISECKCSYNETNYLLFDYNIKLIIDEEINSKHIFTVSAIIDTLIFSETFKISYLFCFRNLFKIKFIIRNIGWIIIILIFIIDIICLILLIKSGFFKKINNFLYLITKSYINYLKRKKKEKNKDKQDKNFNMIKKEKSSGKDSYFNTAPEDKNQINEKDYTIGTNQKSFKSLISNNGKTYLNNLNESSSKKETISKDITEINGAEITKNKYIRKRNTIVGLLYHKSILEKLNETEEKDINNFDREFFISEEEMKNYLILLPEEMDYYESLEKDKRPFCTMLLDLIVKKNIIVNTFFISEETEPIYIKIIELNCFLLIIFVSVSLLFFNDNIAMLYDTSIAKYLSKALFVNSFACFFTVNIKSTLRLILVNKDSIREIMKREKKNKYEMKRCIIKLIAFIKLRYSIFIIINLIFVIVSWYLVSTFNNAYPNIKIVWFIISIIMIFVVQILFSLLAIISICLRYIGLKCKFNFIFTSSHYIYELL